MRSVLLTVPDEGAAAALCEALGEAGIEATTQRSWRQHAYQPSPLATPFEVTVPARSLEAARDVVRRLGHENEEAFATAPLESLGAVGASASSSEATSDAGPHAGDDRGQSSRRLSYAVALVVALVPVVPLACFYAGARRWGALFAGVTLTAFCLMFAQGQPNRLSLAASPYTTAWHGWLRPRDSREGKDGARPSQRPLDPALDPGERMSLGIGRTLTLAKLGDLAVALWLIRRQRLAARG